MKKKALIFILFCILVFPLFAETEIVITDVSGRVELRRPGGNWKTAVPGMLLTKGSYISTGFNASARLEMGETVLLVKQLTRMQLEELMEMEGLQTTRFFLRVGKVRAEIKTAEGLKHNFTMKSPISTAAVRGTKFEFNGLEVSTESGVVALINPAGRIVRILAGEKGSSGGNKKVTTPGQNNDNNSDVSTRAGGVKRKVGHLRPDGPWELSGGIIIIWTKE
jgi:hypothetical protein